MKIFIGFKKDNGRRIILGDQFPKAKLAFETLN
jgi:hypothetical protein